jgi:PTS system nitrogen regulatory IIA component
MTDKTASEKSLAALVEQGGVYYHVSGAYPEDILTATAGLTPACPPHKKEALVKAMMERESLISTAAGRGIALPHPRVPLLEAGEDPFVAIAFPVQPLEWNSPDGSKVHTIFLIVSSSAKQHLSALSKINVLCHQEAFHALLTARAPKEKIIAAIREAEAAWAEAPV